MVGNAQQQEQKISLVVRKHSDYFSSNHWKETEIKKKREEERERKGERERGGGKESGE